MMSETLRPMTSADLSAVLQLEQELFGEEAWSRAMLRGELAQQPASRHYLVADDDGVITGYAGLLAAGSQGDVLTLAVAASRWGQGTGSALLEALLEEAARRGCVEIFLEVRADNTRAQRLYLRYGFVQIGVRRGYYQPSGTDALVMRKALGPDPAGTARAAGAQPGRVAPAASQAAPAGIQAAVGLQADGAGTQAAVGIQADVAGIKAAVGIQADVAGIKADVAVSAATRTAPAGGQGGRPREGRGE